ncbi:MAG: diguanylate cyclase [Acidobacteriota bacterium]
MSSILVVDDSKTFGSLLMRLVERETGCDCVWVKSYAECQRALESAPEPFVAALLDLNLPDAPHGEVVDLALSHHVPSVVFTGELSSELREHIWSKNIVDYVLKEGMHNLDYVTRLLKRLLRNRGLRALVVDDSRLTRARIAGLLKAHAYEVYEAGDGPHALNMLDADPTIQLVLTDCTMPGMDGVALTKAIRQMDGMQRAVIVGVSSLEESATTVDFLKAGANDFITQPFQTEEFYCRIGQNIDMMNMVEDLANMADLDFLTGLGNRKYLFETGRKLFAGQARGELRLSIAVLDLDHFKAINDTFGHDAGDAVLRHFSSLLVEHFDGCGAVARIDGEKFCVACVNVDSDKAFELFDAFRQDVVTRHAVYEEREMPCTVSIGVSSKSAVNFDGLIRSADDLLRQAKDQGRNRVAMD